MFEIHCEANTRKAQITAKPDHAPCQTSSSGRFLVLIIITEGCRLNKESDWWCQLRRDRAVVNCSLSRVFKLTERETAYANRSSENVFYSMQPFGSFIPTLEKRREVQSACLPSGRIRILRTSSRWTRTGSSKNQ